MTRDKRQDQIVDKFVQSDGKNILIGATGFGKSNVGIKLIKKLAPKNILVITPTNSLKKQWEILMERETSRNYKIKVVNTAIKEEYSCDLLILDEVHRYNGPEFSKVYNIRSNYILGLTAEIEEPPLPILDRVTAEECRENEWINDHFVFNMAVPLTENESLEYDRVQSTYKRYEGLLGGKFNAFKRAGELKKYARVKKHPNEFRRNKYSEFYKKTSSIDPSKMDNYRELTENEMERLYSKYQNSVVFWRMMQKRKQILCNAENKVNACWEIVNNFPDKKFIIFSETIKFADRIAHHSNIIKYHSGMSRSKAKEALEEFKESDHTNIVSARSLNEGVNVPSCDGGINAAGNSKKLDNIQRKGRVLRKKEGKISIFINLFIPDTQDEKWMERRQKQTEVPFYVSDVEEIKRIINEHS